MKRKVISLLLALTLCAGLTLPALAVGGNSDGTGKTVRIDSIEISNVVSESTYYAGEIDMEFPLYFVKSPATITLTTDVYNGDLGSSVQQGTFLEDGSAHFSNNENDYLEIDIEDIGVGSDGDPFVRKGATYTLTEPAPYWVSSVMLSESVVIYVMDDETSAPDAPSSWAAESVSAAITKKLVPDTLQSKYTQATTRAEFCALAVALYETATGSKITERAQFTDTDDINVQKMAGLGVVNGIGDGSFAPAQKLTREQAATMLSRLAEAMGKPLDTAAPTFKDNAQISSWAVDAVGQMQVTGIMTGVGDNAFSPKTDYTREQSIVTMLRMLEAVE